MTPSEIRKQTISQLQKTFLKMMSPEWDVALEGKPKNVVADAAKKMLAVQRARLRMENAELASILEKLKGNEEALLKGKQALEDSLKDLEDVKNVLQMTAAFLEIVGRVVAIVA
jgi:sugar-specific transcriptional regulator TrmB